MSLAVLSDYASQFDVIVPIYAKIISGPGASQASHDRPRHSTPVRMRRGWGLVRRLLWFTPEFMPKLSHLVPLS